MAFEMERKAAPLVLIRVLNARRIFVSSSSTLLPDAPATPDSEFVPPPVVDAAEGASDVAASSLLTWLLLMVVLVGCRRDRRVSSLTRSAKSILGSACACVCAYVCVCLCMHVCLRVCVCVCVCVCV